MNKETLSSIVTINRVTTDTITSQVLQHDMGAENISVCISTHNLVDKFADWSNVYSKIIDKIKSLPCEHLHIGNVDLNDEIDVRKVIAEILKAGNKIMRNSRLGASNFVIVDAELQYALHKNNPYYVVVANIEHAVCGTIAGNLVMCDSNLKNTIIVGRRSLVDQPGILAVTNNKTYVVFQQGEHPEYNYQLIHYNVKKRSTISKFWRYIKQMNW